MSEAGDAVVANLLNADREMKGMKEKIVKLESEAAPKDGLSILDQRRLVYWMKDPARKRAILAFTAGAARDAATAFEEAMGPWW